MIKVVFVGDEPSRTNVCDNVAFVGSRSFRTLVKWIKELSPDFYMCLNSKDNGELATVASLAYGDKFKVVCLGTKASIRLTRLGIKHFRLPHPSGLNRNLNDPFYVSTELAKAKEYINEAA